MSRLRLTIWPLLLGLAAGCGLLPSLPALPTDSSFFGGPIPTVGSLEFGEFGMAPIWEAPDVPADVLKPVAGAPPQWWHWVPIHPGPQTAAEYEGGYHYTLASPPSDIQAYYREALPQAGWEPRLQEFVSGDYSMFDVSRYGESVTIYISPHDMGTIVSIVLD
jgi:hypothetical protein